MPCFIAGCYPSGGGYSLCPARLNNVNPYKPYWVSRSHQKGFGLCHHVMRWPCLLSLVVPTNHRLLFWKLLLQISFDSMLKKYEKYVDRETTLINRSAFVCLKPREDLYLQISTVVLQILEQYCLFCFSFSAAACHSGAPSCTAAQSPKLRRLFDAVLLAVHVRLGFACHCCRNRQVCCLNGVFRIQSTDSNWSGICCYKYLRLTSVPNTFC